MLKKIISLIFVLLVTRLFSFAQLSPCYTDEHYRELLKTYPQLVEYEEQFNEQMGRLAGARTTAAAPDTAIYDVPVVVHVIHDYGNENVPDNTVYEAAAYWAIVYMKQNPDTANVIPPFIPYIGNPRIRLHLATIDPNGKPTKGVVRHMSYLTANADDQAKFDDWPHNKYINIWLIGRFGAGMTGAAAYAYTPSTGAVIPFYDGIICLASYTNYAKVIPHELGHVLNLEHPWGSTNSPEVACGDDNVDDTPPTKGHSPVGCVPSALYDTTCATGYLKHYTDIGGADSVANYPDTVNAQNIMDYTYCQDMFTKGQCVRMRTALTSSTAGRNNLYSPANLAATGALAPMPDLPPVADFIVNKASSGSPFTDSRTYFMTFNNAASFSFRNASWNDTISSVSWAFSNGATNPTSSGTSTVLNQFSTPGWVTVTLVANSNAGSDTLVNTHAVYAADTTPVGGPGYIQEFEDEMGIGNWPMFNYYNNPFRWKYYPSAGLGGSGCIGYHSFDTTCTTSQPRITGTAVGDHDDIFTPAFSLLNGPDSLYLDFFTAGASTTKGLSGVTHVGDSMEVDVSTTGGAIWNRLVTYKGADLSNNGNLNVDFVPGSSSSWKPRTISIPAVYRSGNTFFRLRYWPGNTGDNVFVDKLSISGWPAGVKEALASSQSFNIFPNPSSNGCTLAFRAGADGKVSYCITDIAGKVLSQQTKQYTPGSVQQEFISKEVTPAAGMYLVTLTIDGMKITQKFVTY
jgi:hypothetical protein